MGRTILNTDLRRGRGACVWSPIVLAVCLFLVGCVTPSSESDDAGTGISNPPTVPSASFSPDFSSFVFETSLTAEDEDTSVAALTSAAEPAYLSAPASQWTEVFLQGPVARARFFRNGFKEFGDELAAAAAADTAFSLDGTGTTLALVDVTLMDKVADWQVRVSDTDDGAIKVVIVNPEDSKIWGYYLFLTDDDGNPVRGILAYVDHDRLEVAASTGVRFFGLAFDLTDAASAQVFTAAEAFNTLDDRFISFNIGLQCGAAKDCLGEFLAITVNPPERELSSRSVRLGWNDSSHAICLAAARYNGDTLILGTTQAFIGPAQPGEDDIIAGACTIDKPHWHGHTHFLPLRYDDTEPFAGLAGTLADDGSDEASWEAIVDLDAIDRWLGGEFR